MILRLTHFIISVSTFDKIIRKAAPEGAAFAFSLLGVKKTAILNYDLPSAWAVRVFGILNCCLKSDAYLTCRQCSDLAVIYNKSAVIINGDSFGFSRDSVFCVGDIFAQNH